jgi:hypothetical protein
MKPHGMKTRPFRSFFLTGEDRRRGSGGKSCEKIPPMHPIQPSLAKESMNPIVQIASFPTPNAMATNETMASIYDDGLPSALDQNPPFLFSE